METNAKQIHKFCSIQVHFMGGVMLVLESLGWIMILVRHLIQLKLIASLFSNTAESNTKFSFSNLPQKYIIVISKQNENCTYQLLNKN